MGVYLSLPFGPGQIEPGVGVDLDVISAIAGCDLHPKACRRNRALKRHECPLAFGMHLSVREILAEILSAEVQLARIMDGQVAIE